MERGVTPEQRKKTVNKRRHARNNAKARGLQQWVCQKISDLLNIPYTKDDDSLIASRQMGQSGVDVILRGEAAEKFPFSIECKSGESIGWRSAIRQAKDNTPKGKDFLVVLKTKEFQAPIIMIDANVFFRLLGE